MSEVHVTVIGYLSRTPDLKESRSGISWTSLRVGHTPRVRDQESGQWRDAETAWYSVTLFREAAANACRSLRKGDPVVVTGVLRPHEYEFQPRDDAGNPLGHPSKGIDLNIEQAVVALDLSRGTAAYAKTIHNAEEPRGGGAVGAVGAGAAAFQGGELGREVSGEADADDDGEGESAA
ncbi:MAG: single-stranded DNA-binding protein [Promicromonosporaceae bacterium]|nr:single-stranded DNA-binding protein [Promicromonosporaceae bacterium]